MYVPFVPEIPLLEINSKRYIHTYSKIHTNISIVALFIRKTNWNIINVHHEGKGSLQKMFPKHIEFPDF